MRYCDFPLHFKSDMSNIEIEGVMIIAQNFVSYNYELFGDEKINSDDFIYTSTSRYAMLSLNNEIVFIVPSFAFPIDVEKDELNVLHFAITENNMLIMVCEDENEENYYFEIEPQDF